MLKRVYIDNYRCFVNFELNLEPLQLILGLNGTGKSSLLDALRAVKQLVTGVAQPDVLFPEKTLTRWQTLRQQTFEFEVDLDARYLFRLEIDNSPSAPVSRATRIKRELVMCDRERLFEFADGEVHLFNDQYGETNVYPFDWYRSALATIQPRTDNTKLVRFKNWLDRLHCIRLNPSNMSGMTYGEEPEPAPDMSNFASWYRYMRQERLTAGSKLHEDLHDIMPGFESLELPSAGANLRTIAVQFSNENGDGTHSFTTTFEELSDGQRVLICLYAVLNFLLRERATVFLDEPENFLAIPEIQPWLVELQDRIDNRGGQTILISHHPEVVNYLAPEIGLLFERKGVGPVRARKYEGSQYLSPAELIARGWLPDA